MLNKVAYEKLTEWQINVTQMNDSLLINDLSLHI